MKQLEEIKKSFDKEVKRIEDLSYDLVTKKNVSKVDVDRYESRTVRFGFKIEESQEIFTIPDWGNIWLWFEQILKTALEEVEKEKKLTQDDMSIIHSAFRYALGRKTYIVGFTVDYILDRWDSISQKWKDLMFKEINEATDLGWDCDIDDWMRIVARYKVDTESQLKGE